MEYNNYRIVGDGTFGYKKIMPMGQGQVPVELRGSFTCPREAMLAIDRLPPKKEVKKNVKAERTV